MKRDLASHDTRILSSLRERFRISSAEIKGSVNCVLVYEKWFQFFLKPLGELIIVCPGTVADKRGLIVDVTL